MANNFRHSGKRLPVVSASAAVTSGQLVVQEGVFGVALVSVASGAGFWIGAEGVWVLTVPASTVKGDRLFLDGAVLSTDAVNPTITRTGGTGDTLIGIAMSDRDASGKALVLLAPQGQTALA
jgi:predicted RecA/RadA family phage recombinase